MTLDNEQIVRRAYQIAEDKDMAGWMETDLDARGAVEHAPGSIIIDILLTCR